MPFRPPLLPHTLFLADPPDLPVRQSDDTGGPDHVIKATLETKHSRGVILSGTMTNGEMVTVSVTVAAPGIVRVLLETSDSDPARVTLAKDLSDQAVSVSIEQSDDQIRLVTDQTHVRIALEPFALTFYHPDGRTLLEQNATDTDATDRLIVLPFGTTTMNGGRLAFHDAFTVEPDEHFYGFGEKFTDFDKRGQRLEMWHYDAYGVHCERAYKNVPFFVSSRGYGLFVDSTSAIQFDMACSNHSVINLIVPDTALDYYVIFGPDLKSIITRYSRLVSFPILPPKWAFGLWMSSGFLRDTAGDVLDRARQLRSHDVPADVLHLDCYWQKFGNWSDLQWDRELFPDPRTLLAQVHEMGYRVSLWMNPYIGIDSPLIEEAKDRGYLLKTADGNAWIGDLWGGNGHFHPEVGIIDVTNPDAVAWFKDLLRGPLRDGADVYKTDFGEGIPAEIIAHNGMSGRQLHNLYPLIYNDIVAEVTSEITERAGMVWGRSTYAGGQRHAAQWGGDPNCTFQALASTLRGGLSMAMCGHAFWSHDIGGFHGQPTPELYIRWAQFGVFSPLARAHGMSTRLPWDYGEEALRIFREYARLRYRLMPYIYTCATIAHETGVPIIRPMVLEFPDDPLTHTMDLQYMFGADMLVAPIYNTTGQRPIYFPGGRWIDYWNHEVITGPQTRVIEAPLDVLPLYVRANALIPTTEPPDHLSEEPFDRVTFDAYLLERGNFALRDTDGTTVVSAALEGACLAIQVEGAKQMLGFRLLPITGAMAVQAVKINGVEAARRDAVRLSSRTESGWARDQRGVIDVMIGSA